MEDYTFHIFIVIDFNKMYVIQVKSYKIKRDFSFFQDAKFTNLQLFIRVFTEYLNLYLRIKHELCNVCLVSDLVRSISEYRTSTL